MNISTIASQRKTTKVFDATRKIPADTVQAIRSLLQLAPSSANVQPWHFFMASTPEGKARVAQSTQPDFPFNTSKILNASHVVVLCARIDLDDAYLRSVLEQESADGRMLTAEEKNRVHQVRVHYVNLHKTVTKDLEPWACQQVYIALGTLLLGVASLGVDACPMEGFDTQKFDAEFGLTAKGLKSLAMVSLGYSSADDFNAKLPKSRLSQNVVFTDI